MSLLETMQIELKQYITHCPTDEKPSQARLISIFLEGLRNKMLHAHLYAKKHTNFKECYLDAMDYDDNFDISSLSSHGDRKNIYKDAKVYGSFSQRYSTG